ncbi:MAG: hypothetical protein P8Y45_16730 [Exilibacterium sp.]
MAKGEYIILSLLLIAVLVGLLAHAFGFHPAVSTYMAGLVIRKEYFDKEDTLFRSFSLGRRADTLQ